jgi:hypothetical protein
MADVDMLKALSNRGQIETEPEEEMQEEEDSDDGEPNMDPRSMSSDGKTLFIDKEKFPENCKIGDEVFITATVTKLGEKYGVVPAEITKKNDVGKEDPTNY